MRMAFLPECALNGSPARVGRGGLVKLPATIAARLARTLLLMVLAALGTILLVRYAPGFFSDLREMDTKYAQSAHAEQATEEPQQSAGQIALRSIAGWLRGDFGQSRQFGVPVAELVGARIRVSAALLARGLLGGWLLAICGAMPVSALGRGRTLCGLPFTLLLAAPTAALATA